MEQQFRLSNNSHDWLGKGVYFWEDYVRRAWAWAEHKFPQKAVGVIKATVQLGTCIDIPSGEFHDLLA